MHFTNTLVSALLSLSFLQTALAVNSHGSGDIPARIHRNRRYPQPRDLDVAPNLTLGARASGARFTFYQTGLGACGWFNNNNDFIVAMAHAEFDTGHWCGKTITITYGGRSTQARVVDLCEGCPPGALDFSPGLFNFFASQSAGVIYGSWFEGAAPDPKPTTTSKPPPPPPTTTTSTKMTTSTIQTTATSATTTASPSSTPTPLPTGNFVDLNQVLLNLGGLAISAAQLSSQ